MKNPVFILLIFIGLGARAQTYSISGTVSDEKGETLPGATVYLANTKNATATDGSGKFELSKISSASYDLVVNMLGFEPVRQSIKIQDKSVNVAIKLKVNSIQLKSVTINSAIDKNRARYMRIFINNFIGENVSAGECRLLNPEVISFHYEKNRDILTASADEPIQVENDMLGYKIKYLLKRFQYYDAYDVAGYDGDPYFEELEGTEAQQKQWENNRKLAYLGSCRHFFRAAMNNRTREEGFSVTEKTDDERHPLKPVNIDTMLKEVNNNYKALITKPVVSKRNDTTRRVLYITYIKTDPKQLTWIKQFLDTVIIDKNGKLTPGMGVFSFHGQWATQRVAELTPLDYFVDPILAEKMRFLYQKHL